MGIHHFHLSLQINSYKSTADSKHLQLTDTALRHGWPPHSSNPEGSPPPLLLEEWVCWSGPDSRSSRCCLWFYIQFHAPATSSCSLYQWLKWRDLYSVSIKDRFIWLVHLTHVLNYCIFFSFNNTQINKGLIQVNKSHWFYYSSVTVQWNLLIGGMQ